VPVDVIPLHIVRSVIVVHDILDMLTARASITAPGGPIYRDTLSFTSFYVVRHFDKYGSSPFVPDFDGGLVGLERKGLPRDIR